MALSTLTTESAERFIAGGETLTVEFKSEKRNQLSDREIYEAVVCLANAEGGTLFIGVENDGRITGARHRHDGNTNPPALQSAIFNNTVPHINTRISLHHIDEQEIVAIEVDPYPAICALQDGKCVRRVMGAHGPECLPFYPYEHQSRRSDLGLVDYSAQSVEGTTWQDIDPLEIERLRQTIRRLRGDQALLAISDEEVLKALQLVEARGQELVPNVAGLLLVGREESLRRTLPTACVAFQVRDVAGNALVNDRFTTPLLRTLEAIEERFSARNEEAEVSIGPYRVPIPTYDPDAFREAVNNAVLHRDYSRTGDVYIQFHPDHLLITNPGGFLAGITLDNFLVQEPKHRNSRLAHVFHRLGLVEIIGRGIDRIFLGQLRYGRPLPDYRRSNQTGVRLELRGGDASDQFTRLVFEEFGDEDEIPLNDLIALNILLDVRQVSAEEIGTAIQRGDTVARALLEQFVERGWVEARGSHSNRVYQLSASMYRRLGSPSGYVRMRGFEPIRQESMILEYVDAHEKITRADVIELCGLEPRQATYILRRLVDKGELLMVGERRGAYYVRR